MKEFKIFSDGVLLVSENDTVRKASKKEASEFLVKASDEEVVKYLSAIFPKEHNDASISEVALNKEDGYAYAKYASSNKVLRLKVLAQTVPQKTEPVNSIEKADPDVKVPRNESKSKPEDSKGREDINNPTKIREDKYELGDGAKNLHTKEVPRDSSGDGLGGESVSFEKEIALDATSGNPDTYVQEFTDSESPEPASSEKNHAVGKTASDIKLSHDNLRFNFASSEKKEDENKKDDADGAEKTDKSKKLPPWLNKDKDKKTGEEKDEKESDSKSEKEKETKIAELTAQVRKLEKEIGNRKIAEARKEAALGLVLAYRDRQPEKYATAESFAAKVEEIAKKMSVESIDSALEEFNTLIKAESDRLKKTASAIAQINTSELNQPVVFPRDGYSPFDRPNTIDDLTQALMQNTILGKSVSNMEHYHNSNK